MLYIFMFCACESVTLRGPMRNLRLRGGGSLIFRQEDAFFTVIIIVVDALRLRLLAADRLGARLQTTSARSC
jgi:hypothetical protein